MGQNESELVKHLSWALIELETGNAEKNLDQVRLAIEIALGRALMLEHVSEVSKQSAMRLMNAWGDK